VLKIICHNIMGRQAVSLLCDSHGGAFPHCLWSKVRHVGPEDPASELYSLADAMAEALRGWAQGEWEFTDDCYPKDHDNPWNRPPR
jgi:hypothetical protein